MNNPMAGTDPSGYKALDKRRFLVGGESCVGGITCEFNQTFSGPVDNFRSSIGAGSGRSTNGHERMTTEQLTVIATVNVGRPVDIKDGVMLAQEGTMTDDDIREMLGEEAPRAGYRRGTKAAGRIMDALGDVITPGPEDAIGVVGKAKDLKKVGEAVVESVDELKKLRKSSDVGDLPVDTGRKLPFSDKDRLDEINKTLDRIRDGGPFPYKKDGNIFKNKEGLLPSGNYREYTVDTLGSPDRGKRRLVVDQDSGRAFYTDDHYENFVEISP